MNARVNTVVLKTVSFEVFGKTFEYELEPGVRKRKFPLSEIVPILVREIAEVRWEDNRTGAKILLFYTRHPHHRHLLSFKFAVEANEGLTALMKEHHNSEGKIPEMIEYVFNNRELLNFNC